MLLTKTGRLSSAAITASTIATTSTIATVAARWCRRVSMRDAGADRIVDGTIRSNQAGELRNFRFSCEEQHEEANHHQ